MSEYSPRDTREVITDLLQSADEETKKVVSEVFALEREKLHMSLPHGIVENVVKIIEDHVR